MSMMETFKSDIYEDGRTKQAFKDDTDINKLLARAAKGDSISHLAKHGATYGDFSDIDDLLTAQNRLKRGEQIFSSLPGEIKREFNQSPRAFYNFVNDPQNASKLHEILPGLTKPGTQLPNTTRTPQNIDSDPVVNNPAQPRVEPPTGAPVANPSTPAPD